MSFIRHTSIRAVILCLALCFAGAPLLCADSKYTTPEEVFNAMRGSFQAEKAKGVHASFQWFLSGPDGGNWFIVVTDGAYRMGKGTTPNPDVTFSASDKDWVAICNHDLSGTYAYLVERLKIKGPHSVAKKLDAIFP